MKLIIAGKDRAAELGPGLAAEARALEAGGRGASRYGAAESALTLQAARTEGDYLRELNRLIRLRSAIDLPTDPWPARPGLKGSLTAALRGALWRLLRYQQERTIGQVNGQLKLLTDAITYQQARIDALERESRPRADGAPGTGAVP